jgi:hypothetical protein
MREILGGIGLPIPKIGKTRTPEELRLDEVATRTIARIEKLEEGEAIPFAVGAWWAKHGRAPIQARIETLLLYGRKLEAKERPEKPWGYCNDTLAEKKANFYADRAEAESEQRRKEAGNRG